MNESSLEIKTGFKWSLIGHFLLIGIVLIQCIVFHQKTPPYIPTLKVDLVALPDVLKKDLTLEQTKNEINDLLKKEESKKEKTSQQKISSPDSLKVKNRVEIKNKSALERIKALAKIPEDHPKSDRRSYQKLIQGNHISLGSSLSGEAKEAQVTHYHDFLLHQLQEHWTLPTWIDRQDFSARVEIYIDHKGNVQKLHFLKSSGNLKFDEAVKRAIHESEPFPPPPAELQSTLLSDGILFGFPL